MLVSWTLGSSGMLHSGLAFVSEVLSVSADVSLYHALARQNCWNLFLMMLHFWYNVFTRNNFDE